MSLLKEHRLAFFLYFVLALLAYRHLFVVMGDYFAENIALNKGINAYWVAFENQQNRLLTTKAQGAIAKLTGSHETAWRFLLFFFLWATPLVSYFSFLRIFRGVSLAKAKSFIAATAVLLGYLLIVDHRVQFWDLYDICAFSIALIGILLNKPQYVVAAIFLDVTNRESVLFMSSWLFIRAVDFKCLKISWLRFLLASGCFIFSVSVIKALRSLWKRPPTPNDPGSGWLMGNWFTGESQISDLGHLADPSVLACLFFITVFMGMAFRLAKKQVISWDTGIWIIAVMGIMNFVAFFTELRTFSFMLPAYVICILLTISPGAFLPDTKNFGQTN